MPDVVQTIIDGVNDLRRRVRRLERLEDHGAVTVDMNTSQVFDLTGQELGFDVQVHNFVFSGPESGAPAIPTFRLLVAADIPATLSGVSVSGFLNLATGGDLTLDASGAIAVTASRHRVDTYSAAASDDLESITGGSVGDLLLLTSVDNGRDVTVKDNGTGFYLAGDFVMSTNVDYILLIKASATVWVEISRSDNA